MSDLVAFLNARLDEDEAAATPGRRALDDPRFELKHGNGDSWEQHLSSRIEDGLDAQTGEWHARVLREVEAKRRIVEDYRISRNACRNMTGSELDGIGYKMLVAGRDAFRSACVSLAAVYSDHPDYDPAWA